MATTAEDLGFRSAEIGAVDGDDPVAFVGFYARHVGIERFDADHLLPALNDDAMLLYDLADRYVATYVGDFPFLADLARRHGRGGGLTDAQAKGVLNCMLAEHRRAEVKRERDRFADLDREIAAADAYERHVAAQTRSAADKPVGINLADVPSATYTAVLGDGDWLTLRLSDGKRDDGTRWLAYLRGADNERDFEAFATVTPEGDVRFWPRFRTDGRLAAAVAALAGSDADGQQAMRHGYALVSGRCAVCGRTLTRPDSIEIGIGPECLGRIGM